jgi:hypothetical protein
MRQPPENVSSGWCCASSEKPSPARMRAARAGAPWASMAVSRSWISAMRCGSTACSASSISAARSAAAASTVSNGVALPLGASCAR